MKHINAKDLCAYAMAAIGGGYVYGSSGQLCSLSLRESCAVANPSQRENILGTSAKWDGRYVWDCSGLFRGAWRKLWAYRSGGATTIFNAWCTEKGTIDSMPDVPGVLVFRGTDASKQHVGLYVGGGMVVDARGSSSGVMHGTLGSYRPGWTHWAKADEVDYENALPSPEDIPVLWSGHVKTRTGGGISIWRDNEKRVALGKIPEGTEVHVLSDADAKGFAQVRHNGIVGVADLQYIVPEDGEEPAQETYMATVVDVKVGLDLRTEPKNAVNTLLLIPPGKAVEVYPEMAKNGFAYVRYADRVGYCTAARLRRVAEEGVG